MRTLKQLIAATLHSGDPHPEYENKTLSHRQNTATAGQIIGNMDLLTPEDDQDVQVISDKSDYWQKWEEEVRYNSGWTHARDITLPHLMETINEEPSEPEVIEQQTDLEYEDEGRLIIA